MSKQLYAQLFLGERGLVLADGPMVTDNATPYLAYSEQSAHDEEQVNNRSHELTNEMDEHAYDIPYVEPVEALPQDEASLGF